MRKFLLGLCIIVCGFGVPVAASAQTDAANAQAKITAILAQYPNGGQALTDALAQAIEADPSLASAAVTVALTATAAQQTSIGAGLAEAATFFANNASPAAVTAQQEIQAAIASAPASTLTAFNAGGGTTALLALLSGTGGTSHLTTNSCVSSSRPGGRC